MSSSQPVAGAPPLKEINRDLEEKRTQERAKELKMPYVDVAAFPVNPDILHLISLEDAQKGALMLFYKSAAALKIAVADPLPDEGKALLAGLESKGYIIERQLASLSGIRQAHKLYGSDQYKLKTETKNVVQEGEVKYEKELENLSQLKDSLATLAAEEGLNTLNVSAIKAGASDIHYEPEEKTATLRFRIDGVLHKAFEVPHEVYARLANQLKYKAGMKLNITNIPQDGRFRFIVNERKIDVRVSALPTEYGESLVCRILDSGRKFGTYEELGFSGRNNEILCSARDLAQGMILVTGPTGSGKTTTLYVALTDFNQPDLKIITLEDPIEYHLNGITQSQINEKRGYTFADGIRSILRQDPDIVMIGEIRDKETAEAAMQASLTGHVVLSTLHTNSAVETIPRLLTIGVAPFMMAPAISIIVAQRLVRRLCSQCGSKRALSDDEKKDFAQLLAIISQVSGAAPAKDLVSTPRAAGCDACSGTGYRGQLTISEVLKLDDEFRGAILAGKPAADLLSIARKKGMLTMAEDGFLKTLSGLTTLEEVHRVTSI